MTVYKDVVGGMHVHAESGLVEQLDGEAFYFCSDYCRHQFLEHPKQYTRRPHKVLDVTGNGDDVSRRIAYFSMEIAIESGMPTYSGGLGVLAGDTLKSSADIKLPTVGVTLCYKRGYFTQSLSATGDQQESATNWNPADFAVLLPERVNIQVEGRQVTIRAWRRDVIGNTGFRVPVILMDTDDPANTSADRELTDWLYGGDQRYRLIQELILGVGGVRMLAALGYTAVQRFHMNEGHSALLVLELLKEFHDLTSEWAFESVRKQCIFTTHTPIPAGHDRFPYNLVKSVIGDQEPLEIIRMLGGPDELNMTLLAMNISKYVNGVARRHGEVSRRLFTDYSVDSITNGVHAATWTSESFRRLYDARIPGWSCDPCMLRRAVTISKNALWIAHEAAKCMLIKEINRRGGDFTDDAFTLGFARRATPYKRHHLLLSDPHQLAAIARESGPIQIVYAGKAHPNDHGGKDIIRWIVRMAKSCGAGIRVVYLENYDMDLARLITSGVDLWINTPRRPMEASGTSGMKAALNAIPSFSILDGWWPEGCIEDVTGWSIGRDFSDIGSSGDTDSDDAEDLYRKLRVRIAPMFYNDRDAWTEIMRSTVTINASYFNTHRMIQQYAASAYV